MNLLDRFRKSRQKSVLPDEVKQYYQSETRQRRGVAIVLAAAALLVTIAVASGLFFGGRYAYNKIQGDDNKDQKAATSQNEDNDDFSAEDNQEQKPAPSQTPAPAPSTPAPTPAPQPAPAPANPTTPALGDNALPHTGDEGM